MSLTELLALTADAENCRTDTGIPRVAMVRGKVPEHDLAAVYTPMINVILQGRKTMTIGADTARYDPSTYFVMSVDLPAVGAVHPDHQGRPYVAVSLDLDRDVVVDVVQHAAASDDDVAAGSFAVARMTPELLDAWTRLLRLRRRPDEIAPLAPLYEREIVFRVLQGPQGHVLRALALPDAAAARIRDAVGWIRANVTRPVRVTSLARQAGMSDASFHRHFKAVTALSPLQFQKRLRLLQARTALLAGEGTVAAVAFDVGYDSATQFSREYARFFGAPPASDARAIRARLAPRALRGSGKP
ncbi:MAG TPA: AraC family transcriptional regulator [Myxococcota bacterium]